MLPTFKINVILLNNAPRAAGKSSYNLSNNGITGDLRMQCNINQSQAGVERLAILRAKFKHVFIKSYEGLWFINKALVLKRH